MTSEEFKKQGNKVGALKRSLGVRKDVALAPGDLIRKSQAKKLTAKEKLAIMGLV